jgi:hypothetical protein
MLSERPKRRTGRGKQGRGCQRDLSTFWVSARSRWLCVDVAVPQISLLLLPLQPESSPSPNPLSDPASPTPGQLSPDFGGWPGILTPGL